MLTRGITRVLALLIMISLALPLADMTTPPAIAKNNHHSARGQKSGQVHAEKSKTLTFSNTAPITIPGTGTQGNANPFPSTIQASGFKKGTIQDVNVTLNNLSHTFPDDINILLQSPSGKVVVIMASVGGGTAATNVNLTIDDEAGQALPPDGPLVSGTFQSTADPFPAPSGSPYQALSTFDGGNPNGAWNLFVADNAAGDTGTMAGGWSLTIQAKLAKQKKHHKKKHH